MLGWIPGHCDDLGNDTADRLAKEAVGLRKTHPFRHQLSRERCRIRNQIHQEWEHEWNTSKTGGHRRQIDPAPPSTHRFIPWEINEAEGGGLEDMCRKLLEMRTASRHLYTEPPYLFIDHQSVVDGTVIAAGPDLHCGDPDLHQILDGIPDPKVKRMLYCCVPAQRTYGIQFEGTLHDPGNQVKVERFPRPGWPGHGILRKPDDYVPMARLRRLG
ncbi:hypothetical protein EYZ11_001188 [Aspergillus tanneri]|uniref:RNase H type-1 domain-containing protein n=1 Tax=Aspergillus tanneri TaxID=1220188 RepID=A0A4S3JVD1_9EURO|nr:hypothetical protein EYZ11_001188 [Aspergillus tanneri]